MSRRVCIVGATSSLAQRIAHGFARRGAALTLVARDGAELELLESDLQVRYNAQVNTVACELLDEHFNPLLLLECIGEFDDMVIALGDMGNGDNDDPVNIARCVALNHTIPASIASLAAQRLGAGTGGTLAVISSVAGDRGRQSNYAYGSAKAALTTFASGLRNRYAKLGVHVVTVKPGFIDTPMTWGMKSPLIAGRERVAEAIIRAMEKKKNVAYAPCFWWPIMLVIRHIPEALFKRLKL